MKLHNLACCGLVLAGALGCASEAGTLDEDVTTQPESAAVVHTATGIPPVNVATRVAPHESAVLGVGMALPPVFTLAGGDLRVSYREREGVGLLTYMAGDYSREYLGEEITTNATAASTMVSVVTYVGLDKGYMTMSLLIPAVEMGAKGDVPIETYAIFTGHAGWAVVPKFGAQQLDTYDVIPLKGLASPGEL
jgi:hypothetical protein